MKLSQELIVIIK